MKKLITVVAIAFALTAGTMSALTFSVQPASADLCKGKCKRH
jgi:hypothetical protein